MPSATDTFDAALERFQELDANERADERLNPECRPALLQHGARTPRAIVFLHGITSTPFQFRQLGELFHERGYTVYIPRMPRHGFRDRLTADQAHLTRTDLIGYASQAVSLGRALGDHLTVAGLSVSGTVAAYCFQHFADVDLAVAIAPAFAPYLVPIQGVPLLARLALALPNAFVWWDPRRRDRAGPPCGYPRFATHAMAESFLLGDEVYQQARNVPPRARALMAITNPRDMAVNNAATRRVLRRWREANPNIRLHEHDLAPRLGTLHDVIGPYQPGARTDYVYPTLYDLIFGVGDAQA